MSQENQEGHHEMLQQGVNGQVLAMDPNAHHTMSMMQPLVGEGPKLEQQQPTQEISISNEIKRLQHFQQMGAAPGNALLLPTGGGAAPGVGDNNNAAFFQSMMGAAATTTDQKVIVPNPRMDNPLAQNMGVNPMLQPAFLQDARILLAQQQQQQHLNHHMNPHFLAATATGRVPIPGELPLPSPHSLFHRDGSRRMRGGVIEPFPEKLHRLLTEVEAAGRSDVISFVAKGTAFCIHKPDKFFKEIVPLYFRQSRLSSFKRQLNLYGFELINTGPARGGYYHELFVKDNPEDCRRMRRVAVKISKNEKGSGTGETTTSTPTTTEETTPSPADILGDETTKDVVQVAVPSAFSTDTHMLASGEQGTATADGDQDNNKDGDEAPFAISAEL